MVSYAAVVSATLAGIGIFLGGKYVNYVVSSGDLVDDCETVTYDHFLKNARTGDILLGASKEISAMPTRLYTRSPWTHVGLVCRMRDRTDPGSINIVEYSGHNPTEEIYKRGYGVSKVLGDGVGLYGLDDLFANNGNIYWRPLFHFRQSSRDANVL